MYLSMLVWTAAFAPTRALDRQVHHVQIMAEFHTPDACVRSSRHAIAMDRCAVNTLEQFDNMFAGMFQSGSAA